MEKGKGRVDFGKRNHISAGHCQHSGGILSVLPGRRPVWVHDVSDVSGPGGKAETHNEIAEVSESAS